MKGDHIAFSMLLYGNKFGEPVITGFRAREVQRQLDVGEQAGG